MGTRFISPAEVEETNRVPLFSPQMCCAVIAGRGEACPCLLINLWTGVKPTKRTVEMMGFYFLGLATEDDLKRHVAGLQKTKA